MRRLLPVLLLVALALSACARAEHLAVVGNAPGSLGVGTQRVVVAYRTEVGEDLAGPDLEAELVVAREGAEPQRVPTEFVWMTEDVRGLYVATVEFDQPGQWTATLYPEGESQTLASPFFVDEHPSTPEVGEAAPVVASETLDDVDGELALITTDPDPDPAMYEVSADDAVTNGTPAVIVFATPAFCQTAVCGPMLDQVKELRSTTDGALDWVHVEVYELEDVDPNDLTPVPAALEWGLPSEPWVFVVDADGVVTHRFEGVVSEGELTTAVAAVTE
jgi:hypothetical protein